MEPARDSSVLAINFHRSEKRRWGVLSENRTCDLANAQEQRTDSDAVESMSVTSITKGTMCAVTKT